MRTTVITGSASGIGRATRATCRLLEERAEHVIGVDLHDAEVIADLSTTDGRADMVRQVEALTGGRIDAIVANAGLAHQTPSDVAVDYVGALAALKGLRPFLDGSTSPRAVATSSTASIMPVDEELVDLCLSGDELGALERAAKLVEAEEAGLLDASSKAALCRRVRRTAASHDWTGHGIPLNAVAPGVVETPMVSDLIGTEVQRAALTAMVPMPLNGFTTADVPARVLAWPASPENTHLCGQVVFVDGGSDAVIRGDSTW